MFIRIKRVKNSRGMVYPYAYLVGSRWYKKKTKGKSRGPRQVVAKYLGRVYEFSKTDNQCFSEFMKITNIEGYIQKNNIGRIVSDLIGWELFRHGIAKKDLNLSGFKFVKEGKDVSIKINEGMLNSYTAKRLVNFKFTGCQEEDALALARYFIEAGIEIPKDVFIGIFGKVYR